MFNVDQAKQSDVGQWVKPTIWEQNDVRAAENGDMWEDGQQMGDHENGEKERE